MLTEDGTIKKLKRIIIDDELNICADLDREMDEFVNSYFDEWKAVVDGGSDAHKVRPETSALA
jgi:NAD(P)H-nitrite reductase large subunit